VVRWICRKSGDGTRTRRHTVLCARGDLDAQLNLAHGVEKAGSNAMSNENSDAVQVIGFLTATAANAGQSYIQRRRNEVKSRVDSFSRQLKVLENELLSLQ
jgi:hypothetical protein